MEKFWCTLIFLAVVIQVLLWNYMELRNKRPRDENNVNTSVEETQTPSEDASNDTATTPPPRSKRKKKDGESNSFCRFCKKIFTTPQALGGHMNRHRGEREIEDLEKAKNLIKTRGQNFALGYSSGGASSYYQQEENSGNHYQGGGIQMANASMVGNMVGGGLQRQGYQNSNQQFVGASHMNLNYGNHQQMGQASYQPQLQQGSSYVNYNQGDNNAPRPYIPSGVPQTSYMPHANSGQYQAQGTGSLQDVKPYVIPHGGSTTGVTHHKSNTGFTSLNLNQVVEGANNTPTFNISSLRTSTGRNSNVGLHQPTIDQTVAQFVDQLGNKVIQGPSLGYSTGLRPLNASHFHDNVQATTQYNQGLIQDHYTNQTSYADTSILGSMHVQSDQYNATIGMENQYNTPGVDMLNFEDVHEEDEFGNRCLDQSTIVAKESGHGDGAPTSKSADARSHL